MCFFVSAGPYNVDDLMGSEVYRLSGFDQPVAQAEQLIHFDAPHDESGEQ